MEEIKKLLMELKTATSAKRVSLNARDGRNICSIPEENMENSRAAFDAAILGISEMRMTCPCVLIEGMHEKIIIIGAGSKAFLSADLMCETRISEEIKKIAVGTAQKIIKILK